MPEVIIKLTLVIFLSMLAFSIGTFVGEQFSESQKRVAKAERIQYNNEKECKCH